MRAVYFEAPEEFGKWLGCDEQTHEGLSEPYAGVLRKNGAARKYFESRGA